MPCCVEQAAALHSPCAAFPSGMSLLADGAPQAAWCAGSTSTRASDRLARLPSRRWGPGRGFESRSGVALSRVWACESWRNSLGWLRVWGCARRRRGTALCASSPWTRLSWASSPAPAGESEGFPCWLALQTQSRVELLGAAGTRSACSASTASSGSAAACARAAARSTAATTSSARRPPSLPLPGRRQRSRPPRLRPAAPCLCPRGPPKGAGSPCQEPGPPIAQPLRRPARPPAQGPGQQGPQPRLPARTQS